MGQPSALHRVLYIGMGPPGADIYSFLDRQKVNVPTLPQRARQGWAPAWELFLRTYLEYSPAQAAVYSCAVQIACCIANQAAHGSIPVRITGKSIDHALAAARVNFEYCSPSGTAAVRCPVQISRRVSNQRRVRVLAISSGTEVMQHSRLTRVAYLEYRAIVIGPAAASRAIEIPRHIANDAIGVASRQLSEVV